MNWICRAVSASSWQWSKINEMALLKSFWRAMNGKPKTTTLCDAVWFTHTPLILSCATLFHSFTAVLFQRVVYILLYYLFQNERRWQEQQHNVHAGADGISEKGIFATWFVTSDTAIKYSKSHRPSQKIWPQGKWPQLVPALCNWSLYRGELWHL